MDHITVNDVVAATGGRLLCGSGMVPLEHISIDSRTMKGAALFVPLVGEKVDAHRFLEQAFLNGAAACLTSEHNSMQDGRPFIHVEDTRKALQDLGAWYRKRLELPLVGITGSVGKTTTREMVACALSARFRVYKTPGNHNSQVGVPITLTEIRPEDEIGVIELGMSEPGELTVIARLASVNMAVITNIGVAHIEQLGSQENIYKEKLTIQDGLCDGGILFLNGDDPMLRQTTAKEGCRTIYYGTGENCDYRAENISFEEGCPVFTAVHGTERVPVRLKVMGSHHILNAMVSLAVAREWDIPMAEAAARLTGFTGFQNRQQIYEAHGMKLIDDTYNASPASVKAGLEVLQALGNRSSGCKTRKVAVLADMKELGQDAARFHYEIGTYIAGHPVEVLVTFGELAHHIAEGARDQGKGIEIHEFDHRDELLAYLKADLRECDCVLFKGSNSMELGKIAAQFI